MKKKVAFVIPSLAGGGAERVVTTILRNINKDLFDLYIILVSKEGVYLSQIPSHVKIISLNSNRVRYSFVHLTKALNRYRPDVILSTLEHMNLALLMLRPLLKNKPKILIREANTPSKVSSSLSPLRRKIRQYLYNTIYNKADVIIAQCEEMKTDMTNYLGLDGNKIKVIYNPLDIKGIVMQTEGESPYAPNRINFLAVGRLAYQKAFDVLLDAFSIVIDKLPNTYLTILGEGELKTELLDQAKKLGIEKKVAFEGFKDNPYIYYYHADTYVLSSRWEGFPNTLLEALACKTKVVATNCKSGPKEILGDNEYGLLAKVNDPISLAENMIKSIAMGNRSKDRAEYFSVDKIVKEYEKLFLSH